MSKVPEPIRDVAGASRRPLGWAWRVLHRATRTQPEPEPIADVWKWTKQKYRVRSVLLLLINAVLFAVLGCFTYWLRTGQFSPLATQRYWDLWWQAFDPTREQQITLIDFLMYPIPVDQVPMMMVIVGLVLASLTAIPILVSMLYRFGFSLIFTCIIAFVAVLPWLAITVTICCYLARWRRLQFSFRYATALVSLLPLIVYYLSATRNASAVEYLPPIEMAKLYMPWVVALIAACVVMAIVLIIARLVNYRPGAIAPLLAVMFAIPVVLFVAKVGRHELYYRLLEDRFGPGSRACFVGHVDASEIIRRVAQQRLDVIDDPQATLESVMEQVRVGLQLQLASGRARQSEVATLISEDFAGQQYVGVRECRHFRKRFPESRYIPNVLYLQGRAIDMRVDRAFSLFQGALILRYYQDFPNAASKSTWRELHDRFGDSPLASVASLRLATLEAREGKVGPAIDLLNELIDRFGRDKNEAVTPIGLGGWREFLAKRPASGSLNVEPAAVAQEGRKLLDLLVHNRVIDLEPHYGYPVLRKLFSSYPHDPWYRRNLEDLLADVAVTKQYFPTRLADNIELLIATTDPSRHRKIPRLHALIERFAKDPESDALPRARFELGAAYQVDNLLDEARVMFETIRRDHPGSPWAFEAARRLATMGQPGG